jgi:hypothetical protein
MILLFSILVAPLAHAAPSWTFVFAEDGRWQAQTMRLDRDGWPEVVSVRSLKDAASARKIKSAKAPPLDNVPLRNKNGLTLWTVTQQWDWNWEVKFADWIKAELNAGWWKQHGIATDCADVVYSARWIFARNNGLPMANHLITGNIFSHESVKPEWEALPTASDWQSDQRFLAALDYLLSQAFTHSLWRDSYPVAVTPASILPGGYHLYVHEDTGHTQFIYQVGHNSGDLPLVTLNSTVPREVRDMMEWAFFEQEADPNGRALLRMRWPVFDNGAVTFTDPAAMPFYSTEQFAPGFIAKDHGSFWREVYFRLNPQADFDLIAQKTVQQIVDQFKARVPVVENGYRECHANPCLPGTLRYDAWSTPSRDARIMDMIGIFDSMSSMITSWSRVSAIMRTRVLDMGGWSYTAADFMSKWRAETYSSDPNDRPEERWGL